MESISSTKDRDVVLERDVALHIMISQYGAYDRLNIKCIENLICYGKTAR